jgi:signal transduction histidine kinase
LRETFAATTPRRRIRKGEYLLKEGEPNKRLYLVLSGQFRGTTVLPDGSQEERLLAGPDDLLGIQSFFTGIFSSLMTVQALEDGELAYIERGGTRASCQGCPEVALMPVVIQELVRRQELAFALALKEKQAIEAVRDMNRMSYLGKLAAGVAHELNNAIAVVSRGAAWTADSLDVRFAREPGLEQALFKLGKERGRQASSGDVRGASAALRERFPDLSIGQARKLAQMGLPPELRDQLAADPELLESAKATWELGATLNDLQLASQHATHVVESMKNLGKAHSLREETLDLNQTIKRALSILRNVTKGITIEFKPGHLPRYQGNTGEMVQIWQNLIKNACDALHAQPREQRRARPPTVWITTLCQNRNIEVCVRDNGPGIPSAILPDIFEPNVTTKKTGLSFGLGLGLTIVQKLVHEYQGRIQVDNSAEGAAFTVYFPVGPATSARLSIIRPEDLAEQEGAPDSQALELESEAENQAAH